MAFIGAMKMSSKREKNVKRPQQPLKRQHGVVLLIVLIMLVAMTLAGIGMMRSVDTASVVAGNLGYQQSTISASEAGTSSAYLLLMTLANSGNPQDKLLLSIDPGQNCPVGVTPIIASSFCPGGVFTLAGYTSVPLNPCEVTNTCGALVPAGCIGFTYANWYKCASVWVGAPTFTVPNPSNPANSLATVNYLVQRMCTIANTVPSTPIAGNPQVCQAFTPPSTQKTIPPPPSPPAFFYRVTTRSLGPRNSISYTQTLVLISQ
jgi:type IV pilus assembly protein PilX